MSHSIETVETLTDVAEPSDRALHFARFVTSIVATGSLPASELALPQDPGYTVVLDDPTGHFPLQRISPLNMAYELGNGGIRRVYAIGNDVDPRHDLVDSYRILQGVFRGSLRAEDKEQYETYSRLARSIARAIPLPRQFTFRSGVLEDNAVIIRPIDDPLYGDIR